MPPLSLARPPLVRSVPLRGRFFRGLSVLIVTTMRLKTGKSTSMPTRKLAFHVKDIHKHLTQRKHLGTFRASRIVYSGHTSCRGGGIGRRACFRCMYPLDVEVQVLFSAPLVLSRTVRPLNNHIFITLGSCRYQMHWHTSENFKALYIQTRSFW